MGKEGAPGPKSEADPGYPGFVNFIDVVEGVKRENQLAEVEEGAISTMLIHLANISYRARVKRYTSTPSLTRARVMRKRPRCLRGASTGLPLAFPTSPA